MIHANVLNILPVLIVLRFLLSFIYLFFRCAIVSPIWCGLIPVTWKTPLTMPSASLKYWLILQTHKDKPPEPRNNCKTCIYSFNDITSLKNDGSVLWAGLRYTEFHTRLNIFVYSINTVFPLHVRRWCSAPNPLPGCLALPRHRPRHRPRLVLLDLLTILGRPQLSPKPMRAAAPQGRAPAPPLRQLLLPHLPTR